MRRSKHSLSHYQLLTGNMGQLLPIGVVEVLPGDSFRHQTGALIRLSPQVAPVMHPVTVRIHHWFVPNRLLWSDWEDFITGVKKAPDITYPTITTDGVSKELGDYLGVPPIAGLQVDALPFRAYNKIFNEFYRDQDLITEFPEDDQKIKACAWEKDYFTACRPWPQKGDAVSVPLAGIAPVTGIGLTQAAEVADNVAVNETGATGPTQTNYAQSQQTSNAAIRVLTSGTQTGGIDEPQIFADLSAGTSTDVENIRMGFALQRYQEARARYGSRYTEYLRYLGVRPSDARLQRPEYLGGGKATVSFTEVLSTAEGTSSVVGDLTGHGIAAVKSRAYRKFFEEHGHVVSLISLRPKSIYTQGLHRKWLRRVKEDYWQKELEILGQQTVMSDEVYADGSTPVTFGYNDRYHQYRGEWSRVTGEFRDIANYWHLARDFQTQPALNEEFVACDPTKRVFADQVADTLQITANHSIQARRLVRKFAKPGSFV